MPSELEEEIKKDNHVLIRNQLSAVPIDIRNNSSQSGLMLACQNKAFKTVQVFINKKADVNAMDASGWTALHFASKSGCFESLKLILEQDADVNANTNKGQCSIHIAAEEGNLECLKILTDSNGDVDSKDKLGRTPSHCSAENGTLDCLKHLITRNADVTEKDGNGRNLLHFAVASENCELVSFLIEQQMNVNDVDYENNTPIHWLTCWYMPEEEDNDYWEDLDEDLKLSLMNIAEVLIRAGADLSAQNNEGKSALKNPAVQELKRKKPELFRSSSRFHHHFNFD